MKLSMFLSYACVFVFCATFFQGCFSAAPERQNNRRKQPKAGPSTAVFPVGGGIYPDGHFYARVNIGQPPKPYYLDIDTGSDLTWVQCDAPCVNCPKGPHSPYKPRNNVMQCKDPFCAFITHHPNFPCHNPSDQCDYVIEYADHGSSTGVLVKDNVPIQLTNGSVLYPALFFGCGYDQDIQGSSHPPFLDGVLGLANGKSSILSQLHDIGVVRNVAGHCFSHNGGGYLFLGDDLVPSSGIVWAPMLQNSHEKYYSLGPAELFFAGKNVAKGGLSFVLDSGSTYSYFNKQAYQATITMIKKHVDIKQLKDAPEDKTLPVCWKGAVPFKSVSDVEELFNTISLRFKKAKNVMMDIAPQAYLIISNYGNVCLGILDGSEVELGDLNVLGDISMLDKLVVYDNEKQRIGWISANCDRLANTDPDYKEASNSNISREKLYVTPDYSVVLSMLEDCYEVDIFSP
ncbi:hypothetical protein Nepgr_024099 [Nepenthes gracilis]|uniref:Aspartic proteinase Asp1 n=1 Tax=Nepenthes gracilis TaxID=150966 RepID=A0AAD3T425_NEPGR|nr:hypothetical protein Nepgr_024099 [Nepenthes gracilis]